MAEEGLELKIGNIPSQCQGENANIVRDLAEIGYMYLNIVMYMYKFMVV
jgi:hypothetical protein